MHFVLRLFVFGLGLVLVPDQAKLQQTGVARGKSGEVPRAGLCERAEDFAWERVFDSCPEPAEVNEAVTGPCVTTDYRPASTGRATEIEVAVQVVYVCE